jgi:hypothetical protein
MIINIILTISSILITFPLTHIFMKKGLILDYQLTEERQKDLSKFFYIPYLNLIISFFYLIWTIIKFKRPE